MKEIIYSKIKIYIYIRKNRLVHVAEDICSYKYFYWQIQSDARMLFWNNPIYNGKGQFPAKVLQQPLHAAETRHLPL